MDYFFLFCFFTSSILLSVYTQERYNVVLMTAFTLVCTSGTIYAFHKGAWPFGLAEIFFLMTSFFRWKEIFTVNRSNLKNL